MSTLALFCCVNISYSEECPVFVVTFEKNVVSVCHYCSTPPHKLHTLPSFSSDCKNVPVQRANDEIAQHLKTKAKPTETNIHQGESTIQTCKRCLMFILFQPNCHTMKDLQTRVPITTCLNVGLIRWLVPRLSYVFSNQFWGLSNIAYMSPCLTKTNVHQGAASMYSPRSGSQPRLT